MTPPSTREKLSADKLSLKGEEVSDLILELRHVKGPHEFNLTAAAPAPQGKLACQGVWHSAHTFEAHLAATAFPSAAIDLFSAPFLGTRLSLSALCGPHLNLQANANLNQGDGPFAYTLQSQHLRSSLRGAFKQGALTLTDPLYFQLSITPALSQLLFQEMNPLGLSSVRSEGPITLEIAPQGFSYPLFPHDLSRLEVGGGKLELGKLFCHNEGNLEVALGLLKLGQYRKGDELKLWFAPLDFQIQQGVLNCERTELLIADTFQVCLWGDVNFPENNIDAILGLTASCLKKAFSIKNLPEDYVLQIPMRGSLTDVNINTSKATAKVAALLIWQQKGSVGGLVKGPAGLALGEMLNKLGPLPGGSEKAPPPKKPFPWDSPKEEIPKNKKKTSDASSHRTLIHPEDSALKQALKLLR